MTASTGANAGAPRPRPARSIAAALAALAVLTVADLGTKAWAREALSEPKAADVAPPVCAPDATGRRGMQRRPTEALVLIAGHLELRYAENCGGAFSMLGTAPRWVRTTVFTLAALAFMAVLLGMYVRGGGGRLFALAVPAILSGAVGNLFDRVRYGYVTDFIRYHGLFEWPTFNVADIAITVGGALFLLDNFATRRRASSREPSAETAAT